LVQKDARYQHDCSLPVKTFLTLDGTKNYSRFYYPHYLLPVSSDGL